MVALGNEATNDGPGQLIDENRNNDKGETKQHDCANSEDHRQELVLDGSCGDKVAEPLPVPSGR